MKVQVSLKNYRRSAKKVREIIPVIKGLPVEEAEFQLRAVRKGSRRDLLKLLLSAIAAAETNFNLPREELVVKNVVVQEGRTLKRWRARAYGRANQILKRTCHVVLTLVRNEDKIDNQKVEQTEKAIKVKDSKKTRKVKAKTTKSNKQSKVKRKTTSQKEEKSN